MKTQPRVVLHATLLPAALSMGLGLSSSFAHAEARQVGGDEATWDKATLTGNETPKALLKMQ